MAQKLQMFVVFDKKAVSYAHPTFFPQKGQAIRTFQDAINDPQTQFNRHPEDFALYHVGEFDDTSGTFTPLPAPVHLEEALNLKN